ncbi:RNA-binding domain-containing protein [Basidiobolus meristosporus CBS 931.73]|uniref:RNA-binding domain-containing protein n=1 Tax=Basidiobolus meristosporus CBS 931.73 TaxID=1314790 RepID=A0A1Y1XKP3_9FUNG|nr:RNA-binding domain-containing protein [Basidiobolus meristosporus CBS 931.73]|eukprot:ORX86026.1 RNA-binding domain-containing protein [Basidiobolus meristosporus CBS 931.73]
MTENTPALDAVEIERRDDPTAEVTQTLEATHLATEEEVGYKVFVGNLSFQTTEEELENYFGVAGKVLNANVITRGTRSLGYGFVSFETEKEAEEAVKQLDKKELAGREINVEVAKPKEIHGTQGQAHSQRGRGRGGRGRGRGNLENRRRFSNQEHNNGENRLGGQALTHPSDEASPASIEELDYSQTAIDSYQDQHRGRGRGRGSARGRRFGRGRGGLASQPHLGEPSTTTVFVSNLPYSYGNVELQNLFQGYNIVSSHVAYMKSGRSKGFGFVEFADEAEQQRALANNASIHVDERDISVKVARNETHSENTRNDEHNQAQPESSNPAPPSSSE